MQRTIEMFLELLFSDEFGNQILRVYPFMINQHPFHVKKERRKEREGGREGGKEGERDRGKKEEK